MGSSPQRTFLYFAYGSNLLKRRIRIKNPSAEFVGIGYLDDHRLDFIRYGGRWRGASATIVPTAKNIVWGAVWRLDISDLPALDKQEGVEENYYFAKMVPIKTPDNNVIECRTYQQTVDPPITENWQLPPDRLPSKTYMECIINGAIECEIPEDYIQNLKSIPHNGQEASPKMLESLRT